MTASRNTVLALGLMLLALGAGRSALGASSTSCGGPAGDASCNAGGNACDCTGGTGNCTGSGTMYPWSAENPGPFCAFAGLEPGRRAFVQGLRAVF